MRVEITEDAAVFDRWAADAGFTDAYTSLGWAELWAGWELGLPVGIRGVSAAGTVLYPVVRVPLEPGLCDLRAAYDFGGPVATEPSLLEAFDEALDPLRADWGVVTEFARLHPWRPLPPHAEPIAEHVAVDFSRDGIEGSSTHRRHVRRARREGLSLRWSRASADREHFLALYAETMDRVGAGPNFRFDPELLSGLMARDDVHLALVGDLAAALFLDCTETVFYFLGASSGEGLSKRPNNLLFHEALSWARDRGAQRLHLGGGGESLQRFKRRIGNVTVPYALWRRVHRPDDFARLAPAGERWFPPWFPALHARRW